MSRSNPTVNNPHPASRWVEWNGAKGTLRYFDKEINNAKDPQKKGDNVIIAQPFTFLVLEETAAVKGWHKPSKSSITSNEVKDTREQPFYVKSFKGGPIANGLYAQIKEKVTYNGGYYQSNVYAAFKNPATKALDLAVLQFNGACLKSWMDFRKKAGKALYEKAIVINGSTVGHTGEVEFHMPIFSLKDVTPETDTAAIEFDAKVLQPYLKEYFSRGVTHAAESAVKGEQIEETSHVPPDADPPDTQYREEPTAGAAAMEEDDIPFMRPHHLMVGGV
jgi:hypothetical protein